MKNRNFKGFWLFFNVFMGIKPRIARMNFANLYEKKPDLLGFNNLVGLADKHKQL